MILPPPLFGRPSNAGLETLPAIRLPFASQCSSTNSVTKTENSKYHLPQLSSRKTVRKMSSERLRRSSRIPKEIPILLVGSDMEGKVFSEQAKTVLLSRHGAGIRFGIQAIARTGADPSFPGDE